MGETELFQLLGYYGSSSPDIPKAVKDKIKSGAELDVGKIYHKLSDLSNFEREMKNAKELLTRCANSVDITRDAIGQLLK